MLHIKLSVVRSLESVYRFQFEKPAHAALVIYSRIVPLHTFPPCAPTPRRIPRVTTCLFTRPWRRGRSFPNVHGDRIQLISQLTDFSSLHKNHFYMILWLLITTVTCGPFTLLTQCGVSLTFSNLNIKQHGLYAYDDN